MITRCGKNIKAPLVNEKIKPDSLLKHQHEAGLGEADGAAGAA